MIAVKFQVLGKRVKMIVNIIDEVGFEFHIEFFMFENYKNFVGGFDKTGEAGAGAAQMEFVRNDKIIDKCFYFNKLDFFFSVAVSAEEGLHENRLSNFWFLFVPI